MNKDTEAKDTQTVDESDLGRVKLIQIMDSLLCLTILFTF